jgi:hypothetical protein
MGYLGRPYRRTEYSLTSKSILPIIHDGESNALSNDKGWIGKYQMVGQNEERSVKLFIKHRCIRSFSIHPRLPESEGIAGSKPESKRSYFSIWPIAGWFVTYKKAFRI